MIDKLNKCTEVNYILNGVKLIQLNIKTMLNINVVWH